MNILFIKTFISKFHLSTAFVHKKKLLSHCHRVLILLRQVSDFIHMTVNCDDHKHFNL